MKRSEERRSEVKVCEEYFLGEFFVNGFCRFCRFSFCYCCGVDLVIPHIF
jgi:hypothetical protein